MSAIDYDRIHWQDNLNTPLGQRNLNKMDKGINDVVEYINRTAEYILLSSNWVSTQGGTYPYVNELAILDEYTIEDHPIAQVWGINEMETPDEITAIGYIKKVIANPTGIKVYASNVPTVNLKLILKE